ncbi:MAG: isocitrate lyase/phosphoenolpyruvate mutase family protein [Candidatus Dormiibacterota bacterium]
MTDERPARAARDTTRFRALHEGGRTFLMPNAWDAGSAILLARAGFDAIATTSAGIAFSLGRPDHVIPEGGARVARAQMFERVREITAAVDLPVNGDLEDGYGERPEDVAETIRLAIESGLAGGNIEDHAGRGLYDPELAAERIAAAREAADASAAGFVVTARTDGLLLDPGGPLEDAIRRANRYRQAGADCLYVPGVNDLGDVATLVREIAGPLNVVMGLGGGTLTVDTLRDIGVTRISLGGTIARAALAFVRDSARELVERGTLDFARGQFSQGELNAIFSQRPDHTPT